MKVRTIIRFFDRQADLIREIGDVFDVDGPRLDELLGHESGRLVQPIGRKVEQVQEAPAELEAREDDQVVPDEKLTVADLKEILEARGVEFRAGAKKPELLGLKKASD